MISELTMTDHFQALNESSIRESSESSLYEEDEFRESLLTKMKPIADEEDEFRESLLTKMKPIADDFMSKLNESIRFDGSVSELSYSVNDSARGLSFDEVYDQKELLGEGGFAMVYRCTHRNRGYSYAVKEVENMNSETTGESIKEETDSLKKLRDGPYIVKLWDVFTGPDKTHLIMELMRGGDLLTRLHEKEVFTESESRRISRKLIEAVFFCHKKHIVHRDIKPENILLSSRLDDTKIKLGDFGCSRPFIPGEKSIRTLCGSPQYAAPDLYMQEDGYDEKCDIWSIGVVIFVILGGYAPFEGDPMELPGIICEGYVEFPSCYWKDISYDAKDLIKSFLVVDPEERETLVGALDSEWLRRRDKEYVLKYTGTNMDGSHSNVFDAWVKLQNESSHSRLLSDSSHTSSKHRSTFACNHSDSCISFTIDELEPL